MPEHEHDAHAADAAGHDAHDAHDAHAVAVLGPIDWRAWAMAVLGGAAALLVALALVRAAHP
jgi:hypothetical protein